MRVKPMPVASAARLNARDVMSRAGATWRIQGCVSLVAWSNDRERKWREVENPH